MNNIYYLINQIKYCYADRDYVNALHLIDKYINNKNYGIYPFLLDMQMNCLIELGKFKEASEVLTDINRIFPTYNAKSYSVSKYIICNDIDKALNVLNNQEYDYDTAYNLGKVYALQGKYEEAKKHFLYAFQNHELINYREKAKRNINQILNHEQRGAYVPRDYKYFKNNGGTLREGDVIFADEVSIDVNEEKLAGDVSTFKKPYLIWKIVKDKIFTFPLSLQSNNLYSLQASKYPNTGINRYVVPYVVVINEDKVNKIYDHLIKEDFDNIKRSVYRRIISNGESDIKSNLCYINSVMRNFNINIGDILCYFDEEKHLFNNYLVLSIYDNDYKVVKVVYNNNVWSCVDNICLISREDKVYDVYKINLDRIDTNNNDIREKILAKKLK